MRTPSQLNTVQSLLFGQLRQVAARHTADLLRRRTARASTRRATATSTRIILALATIYLVWGSTYLSVEFILPAVPPLLIAGARFTLCGAVLYAVLRWTGRGTKPTRTHWIRAAGSGLCLILGGNAMVVVAQVWITSSLAALLVATVPFFMVILGWMTGSRSRPGRAEMGLLLAGLGGLVMILRPGQLPGGLAGLGAALLVLFAAASWATGSLIAKSPKAHPSPMLFASMQMLAAGPVLLLIAALLGDFNRVFAEALDGAARGAFFYLTVVGTVGGYCVYVWLVRHTDALTATSYAYVNPVVAMLLGWAVLREPLSVGMLSGSALVLLSVALLLALGRRPREADKRGDRTRSLRTRPDRQPWPAQATGMARVVEP